jgi:hypothetical protein
MAQRTVRGTIRKPDMIWANARLEFSLVNSSYTPAVQYPRAAVVTRASVQGLFSVSLWVNEEGTVATRYLCRIENDKPFEISIAPGSGDLELSVLRDQGVIVPGGTEYTSILTYIDQKIAAVSTGTTWGVTNQARQLAVNNAYVVDSLSLSLLQLPATAAIGDRVIVNLKSGSFRITQLASQQCQVGDKLTTVGLSGSILSTQIGDFIELIFLGTMWVSIAIVGNFQIF